MTQIPGQLNSEERRILVSAIRDAPTKPKTVLEVGTWLGGGSTLHLLSALEANGQGHLWGIEAVQSIYDQMIANIRTGAPEAAHRFTPLFGFSKDAIPRWLADQGAEATVDVVFLDGGDNPFEQIVEFKMLSERIPIGGQLLAHDTLCRKGKWLRPYLQQLDNWQVEIYSVSAEGLLRAVKTGSSPSLPSLRRAEAVLRKLRLSPSELVGRFLPSWLNSVIWKVMPQFIRARMLRA